MIHFASRVYDIIALTRFKVHQLKNKKHSQNYFGIKQLRFQVITCLCNSYSYKQKSNWNMIKRIDKKFASILKKQKKLYTIKIERKKI